MTWENNLPDQRKAACNDYPLVLLFSEATTTNGRALIHFKLGAFSPGLPIEAIVIHYPFVHFDNSW
jgi:lysophosphatidylcholine acyltransferase/lyso-PAF acetyltransferase